MIKNNLPIEFHSTITSNDKGGLPTSASRFLPPLHIDDFASGNKDAKKDASSAAEHKTIYTPFSNNTPRSETVPPQDGPAPTASEGTLSRTPSGDLVWGSKTPEDVSLIYKGGGVKTGWHKDIQDGEYSWVGYVGEEPLGAAPKGK